MCKEKQQAGLKSEEINREKGGGKKQTALCELHKSNSALLLHKSQALPWSRDADKLIKLFTSGLAECLTHIII